MEKIFLEKPAEAKKEKRFLEKQLKVKISFENKFAVIEGEPVNEYEAIMVFEAINLGFSARTASLITDENFIFEKINMKDYTKRKNLDVVRGRMIGTHGKTKKTIEQISGSKIKIKDNTVAIIGPAESISNSITAITNIIRGSKQANMYRYLERINTEKRKRNFYR